MFRGKMAGFGRFLRLIPLPMVLLSAVTACSRELVEVFPPETNRPKVFLLLSMAGLGDMSYNDNILRSVLALEDSLGFETVYFAPDAENGAAAYAECLARCRADGEAMMIVADAGYESMMRETRRKELEAGIDDAVYDRILTFETASTDLPANAFFLYPYGVSFLAGTTVRAWIAQKEGLMGNVLFVGGAADYPFVQGAMEGFCNGFDYPQPEVPTVPGEVFATYLSETTDGFSMQDSAYRLVGAFAGEVDFVYSVAGASNSGIFRYMREYDGAFASAGMDVDQSHLATGILFSLVKRMDKCLAYYVRTWLETRAIERYAVYGLGSGFIELVPAERYLESLGPLIEANRGTAIEQERLRLTQVIERL